MGNRLIADEDGATFVEFTVLAPLLFIVTLGLVDLGMLMFAWSDANRATQLGARYVATSTPMANGIDGPIAGITGVVNGTGCIDKNGNTYCQPKLAYTCTANAGSGGKCRATDGTEINIVDSRFNALRDAMDTQFFTKGLDRRQIVVTYTPLMQGYAGRPKTPMNVTVSLRCMRQEMFFLSGLLGWIFPANSSCIGIPNSEGYTLEFSTTLPSEDLSDS